MSLPDIEELRTDLYVAREEMESMDSELQTAQDKIDALTRALTELYLVTVQPPCEPWVRTEFLMRHNRAMITARLLLPGVVR